VQKVAFVKKNISFVRSEEKMTRYQLDWKEEDSMSRMQRKIAVLDCVYLLPLEGQDEHEVSSDKHAFILRVQIFKFIKL